ncbi:hypothetical protein N9E47_00470 [Luminiphilus sp.]|nr:hypothetical protein [Luminiphilus sp.]
MAHFTQRRNDAVRKRFGGAVDMLYASLSADNIPNIPHDVLQDIQAIDVAFTGFQRNW